MIRYSGNTFLPDSAGYAWLYTISPRYCWLYLTLGPTSLYNATQPHTTQHNSTQPHTTQPHEDTIRITGKGHFSIYFVKPLGHSAHKIKHHKTITPKRVGPCWMLICWKSKVECQMGLCRVILRRSILTLYHFPQILLAIPDSLTFPPDVAGNTAGVHTGLEPQVP